MPTLEPLPRREAQVGPLTLQRVLPARGRRMIGPWCFFDRYGPMSFAQNPAMDVAPHPHIGLQTVSWLFDGEIIHNDSLGSECLVRPGHLSLMTAGRGIAHAEQTPRENSGKLNGVQLWIALPDAARSMYPKFQCTSDLGSLERPSGAITVFAGDMAGRRSAGEFFSPTVAAQITLHERAVLDLPLDPAFEHGIMLVEGDAHAEAAALDVDTLYYIARGSDELRLKSERGARLLLIGGAPFGEPILMWWNFVARNAEEMAEARHLWETRALTGEVPRYNGPRLEAPELPGHLIARPGLKSSHPRTR